MLLMATQREWHSYQDFLDFLDIVKENRISTNSLFNYELDQVY